MDVIRRSRPSHGFALLEVLVGAGLLGIAALAVAQLAVQATVSNKQVMTLRSAIVVRTFMERLLQSPQAWQMTVDKNSITASTGLSCLKNKTLCTGQTDGYPFALYDESGVLVLPALTASSTSTAGLDYSGAPCANYGQGQCQFRYFLRWYPECGASATDCMNPLVRIVADFEYSGGSLQPTLNPSLYGVDVTVGMALNTVQDHCGAVGASYDPQSNKCIPGNAIPSVQTCPPNHIVRSIDASGKIVCGPYFKGSCPSGEFIVGMNTSGQLQCQDIASAPCPTPIPPPAPPATPIPISPPAPTATPIPIFTIWWYEPYCGTNVGDTIRTYSAILTVQDGDACTTHNLFPETTYKGPTSVTFSFGSHTSSGRVNSITCLTPTGGSVSRPIKTSQFVATEPSPCNP